jgi:hypothetical protein
MSPILYFCEMLDSNSNPESCRSKLKRYCNLATQLPINLATHLPVNLATHLPVNLATHLSANLATHLPNQLSHQSFLAIEDFSKGEMFLHKISIIFYHLKFSHWKKLSTAELNFERRCQTLKMTFSLCSTCYILISKCIERLYYGRPAIKYVFYNKQKIHAI